MERMNEVPFQEEYTSQSHSITHPVGTMEIFSLRSQGLEYEIEHSHTSSVKVYIAHSSKTQHIAHLLLLWSSGNKHCNILFHFPNFMQNFCHAVCIS
jgi:hypothetical protein